MYRKEAKVYLTETGKVGTLSSATQIMASVDQDIPDAQGFPSDYVQTRVLGRSGVAAIEEIAYHEGKIKSASKVLDFGVGWGRIAQLSQKTVSEKKTYFWLMSMLLVFVQNEG